MGGALDLVCVLPLVGLPKPLRVHLDFTAEAIDREILQRLAESCAANVAPVAGTGKRD